MAMLRLSDLHNRRSVLTATESTEKNTAVIPKSDQCHTVLLDRMVISCCTAPSVPFDIITSFGEYHSVQRPNMIEVYVMTQFVMLLWEFKGRGVPLGWPMD